MCYDPWEESTLRMGELMLGHLKEVERGRNVEINMWKAEGFLTAIGDKYDDEDEFDIEELEEEIEYLRELAVTDPRWLRQLERAEQALKKRAEEGTMVSN